MSPSVSGARAYRLRWRAERPRSGIVNHRDGYPHSRLEVFLTVSPHRRVPDPVSAAGSRLSYVSPPLPFWPMNRLSVAFIDLGPHIHQ